jgi:hypothetical protein
MIGWWAVLGDGGDFGYTPEMRLAFLRKEGFDPIDLSVSGMKYLSNGGASLPFFPDEGVTLARDTDYYKDYPVTRWAKFRREHNEQFLAALYTQLRQQAPKLNLAMAERSGDATAGTKFWASWDAVDKTPLGQELEDSAGVKDPHGISRTVYAVFRVHDDPNYSIADQAATLPLYFATTYAPMYAMASLKADYLLIDLRALPLKKTEEFLKRALQPKK